VVIKRDDEGRDDGAGLGEEEGDLVLVLVNESAEKAEDIEREDNGLRSKQTSREREVSAERKTSGMRVESDATNLVWSSEWMRIPEIPAERLDEWYPSRVSSMRRFLGARVDDGVRE
jgi:hypothetical protein